MTTHPVFQEHGQIIYQVHAFLENIFQCTFHKLSSERNPDLRFLLDEQNKGEAIWLFTFENFEDIIQKMLESTVYFQSDEKLIFLHNIYTRLYNNSVNNFISGDKIHEMMQISMSYITSYLMSPEVFSSDITPEDAKNPIDYACLLYDAFYTQLINVKKDNFLKDLVVSLGEEDYEAILGPIFKRIQRDCIDSSLDNSKKTMDALKLLETLLYIDKRVVKFFVNHYTFLPNASPADINGIQLQKMTVFGACLSMTSFPTESKTVRTFFAERNSLKNSEEIISMLRGKIHAVVDTIYKIMEYIMKCDAKYKRNILNWLYIGISVNDAKQKTYNYGSLIASDGWFTNFLLLLMKFAHKMLGDINKYATWFQKIDFDFLKHKPIFNNLMLLNGKTNIYLPVEITNSELCIKSEDDLSGSPNGKQQSQQEKYTFLSELVFIINHAVYLQSSTQKTFIEFLHKMQKQHTYSGPFSRNFISLFLKKLAFDVQLSDPYLLSHMYKLLTFDILLILFTFNVPYKKSDEISQIFENIKIPKAEDNDEAVSLPMYWTENIQEGLQFLRNTNPSVLMQEPHNFEIAVNFIISILSNESCLHNPHLKAKYLQILTSFVPQKEPTEISKEVDFSSMFTKNEYLKNHLIKNLMQFFLEVDRTCSNSQFYENYSYKHGCCVIINYLLKKIFPNDKDSYAAGSLNKIAKDSFDDYLQFWTKSLNDMISLLDEVLEKIQAIKSFQEDTEVHALWLFSFHERHERTVAYESNKKLIQTFQNFLNAYFSMLAAVVKVSPRFFIQEEIKEKLVVTLNYSLQQITGRNANKIKMKKMRELQFDPKNILEDITHVYLQFKYNNDFLTLVVNDERSFDIEITKKLLKTIKKYTLLTEQEEIEAFERLIEQLAKKAKEKSDEDTFIQEIKDIPEEFLDPIMNHIMKDPVLLPTSNMIVDRVTILKHLAVDDTDPFNRAKLTKEMFVPQPELKTRIEAFFELKRKEKRESK